MILPSSKDKSSGGVSISANQMPMRGPGTCPFSCSQVCAVEDPRQGETYRACYRLCIARCDNDSALFR